MYFDVPRAYKKHMEWGRSYNNSNYTMKYETYLTLQYDSIKHVFLYNNKERQQNVYYLRI